MAIFQVESSPTIAFDANLLAAEERFLRVLNVPLLKNKLPEHIRERMLHYKEAIEATRSKQGRPVEEWVSAMK